MKKESKSGEDTQPKALLIVWPGLSAFLKIKCASPLFLSLDLRGISSW